MHISKLIVRNFRNLAHQEIVFPKRVTVVIGCNGHGKTNLLEAIYLLAQGKSFRATNFKELQSWDIEEQKKNTPDFAFSEILAEVSSDAGMKEIRCQIEEGKRRIFINNKRVAEARDFFGQLRVVEFTPDDLQIIKGSPSERRQYIDRVLAMVDPIFVESSVAYERALKNRNLILKQYAKGNPALGDRELRLSLLPWDELLIRHGRVVAGKRIAFLRELIPYFFRAHQRLAEERSEEASLNYKSSFCRDDQVLEVEQLKTYFDEHFFADRRKAQTTGGVQRDDIEVKLDTGGGLKEARMIASQGQARSLALALKLAAVDFLREKTGESPLLLLDDVESELDTLRRSALFSLVESTVSQVFITTTELSEELSRLRGDSSVYRINAGLALLES